MSGAQPRIFELARGRINCFSIDKLISMHGLCRTAYNQYKNQLTRGSLSSPFYHALTVTAVTLGGRTIPVLSAECTLVTPASHIKSISS